MARIFQHTRSACLMCRLLFLLVFVILLRVSVLFKGKVTAILIRVTVLGMMMVMMVMLKVTILIGRGFAYKSRASWVLLVSVLLLLLERDVTLLTEGRL